MPECRQKMLMRRNRQRPILRRQRYLVASPIFASGQIQPRMKVRSLAYDTAQRI
jgi:hypothetical protein